MQKNTFAYLLVLCSLLIVSPEIYAGRQHVRVKKSPVSGMRVNADVNAGSTVQHAVTSGENVEIPQAAQETAQEAQELYNEEAEELSTSEDFVKAIEAASPEEKQAAKIAQKEQEEKKEAEKVPADLEKYLEKDSTITVDFDPAAKRTAVIELVNKAVKYLENHGVDESFSAFSHSKDFINGELHVFAYNTDGICMADGESNEYIWVDMKDKKDLFGVPVVQSILDTAKKGDGWVTYQWRNATKVTYVKSVKKGEDTFVIGVGYYPQSKEDAVVNLVKGAVALFNKTVADKQPVEDAFSQMSYRFGRFVMGDLYLYALDFTGMHYAHGERPGVVGTSGWDYKDSAGTLVNQEIIKRLKKADKGIWFEYVSKRAMKKAYVEKVVDAKGKEYFISCGYYPDANRRQLVDLVRLSYQYMKGHGKTKAADAFNNINDEEFRYGDLSIFVFDMKGVCVAFGSNPTIVGKPCLDLQDEFGSYYVRNFIEKAKNDSGWVDFKINNAFASAYVEKIDLGEEYVIGSFMYPLSKRESAMLLSKSAASYLQTHDKKDAFRQFTRADGMFIRGDLSVSVFDQKGICLAYGDNTDLIWRNLFKVKDDEGKPFVRLIIETVKRGAGVVTYKLNGAEKNVFVEPVDKGNWKYAVASGFYL